MQLSEGQIQVGIEAAARKTWEMHVAEVFARKGVALRPWEDLRPRERNALLDNVLPPVWAAVSAIPDPMDEIRQLMAHHDSDPSSSSMDVVNQIRKILRRP